MFAHSVGFVNGGPVARQGRPSQGILPLRLSPTPTPTPAPGFGHKHWFLSWPFPLAVHVLRRGRGSSGAEGASGMHLILGLLGVPFSGPINSGLCHLLPLPYRCQDFGDATGTLRSQGCRGLFRLKEPLPHEWAQRPLLAPPAQLGPPTPHTPKTSCLQQYLDE